jgi:hypothetical protein
MKMSGMLGKAAAHARLLLFTLEVLEHKATMKNVIPTITTHT